MKKDQLNKWPDTNDDILHVYGQHYEHGSVYMCGTRMALEKLRDALTKAINDFSCPSKTHAINNLFINDGEGFDLYIKIINDQYTLQHLAVPYTHSDSEERSNTAIFPWE